MGACKSKGAAPMTKRSLIPPLALIVMASPAAAHVGVGNTSGFLAGAWHPLSGVDHILAMVMIGIWAAMLGGRALWLVPLSFVSMMIGGGALSMAGIGMPYVELLIAASIIGLGALITFEVRLPVIA